MKPQEKILSEKHFEAASEDNGQGEEYVTLSQCDCVVRMSY